MERYFNILPLFPLLPIYRTSCKETYYQRFGIREKLRGTSSELCS